MNRSLLRCSLLLIAALSLSGALQAAERVILGDMSESAAVGNRSARTMNRLQALRSEAENKGTVRVIVGVRAPFAPEGRLSAETAIEQRNDIATAQSTVLKKLSPAFGQQKSAKRFTTIPFMALEVDQAEFDALAAHPDVTSIEEDALDRPLLAESSPLIGASNAWASSYTGSGQTIAILDTGVDKAHPFLTGKVLSEACYSTTKASDAAVSICPGTPPSPPDGAAALTTTDSGVNCSTSIPGCDHGTRVAGIAAGTNVSFSGVAKGANLISIQVFSKITSSVLCSPAAAPCLTSYVSDQILALERVLALKDTYKIAAVNLSFGGGRYYDQASCDAANAGRKTAIDNLRAVGIATIASSGNDAYVDSMAAPACISSVISVGSTWDASGLSDTLGCTDNPSVVNKVACYSNSAPFLNLLAPGSLINAPAIPGTGYSVASGTSMAAPQVAGAWALLKQQAFAASGTNLLVDVALAALTSTGLTDTPDTRIGAGSRIVPRIKIDAALVAIGGVLTNTVQLNTSSVSVKEGGAVVLTVTRTGYTGGASTVAYSTSNGTALAGSDYTAASRTLSFAADETSKTITLSTLKDTALEANETFSVTLSSPSGSGTSLGSPATATIFITDASGWKTSAGANAGWATASDFTYSGSPYSLKSGAIANGQTAAIEVKGSFKAGTVAFAKKVSSEAGKDVLTFFVDGVVRGGPWSGESDWAVVSYPVNAGVHTFKWQYSKDSTGSAGSDAAWIDSIVLPVKNVNGIASSALMLLFD